MGDDREPLDTVPAADEADRRLQLAARVLSAAERRMCVGRLCHFGIRLGQSPEAVEV